MKALSTNLAKSKVGLKSTVLNAPLDEAITKATTSKETPVKPDYMRKSWNYNAVNIFEDLLKHVKDDVVFYKVLAVIHSLLREGSPKVFEVIIGFLEQIKGFERQFQHAPHKSLISSYTLFILSKVAFHQKYPLVNGRIDTTEFKGLSLPFGPDRYNLLNDLLESQMLLFAFATQALQQPVTDFKLFPIVTCIKEAYSINSLVVHILNEIFANNAQLTPQLHESYVHMHSMLGKFYNACSTFPYILSLLTVPTLGDMPPQLQKAPKEKIQVTVPLTAEQQAELARQQQQQQYLQSQAAEQQRIQQAILAQQQEQQRQAQLLAQQEEQLERERRKEQKRLQKMQQEAQIQAQQQIQAEQQRQAQLLAQQQAIAQQEEAIRQAQIKAQEKAQRKLAKQAQKQALLQQQQIQQQQIQQQQLQQLAQQQAQQEQQKQLLMQKQMQQQMEIEAATATLRQQTAQYQQQLQQQQQATQQAQYQQQLLLQQQQQQRLLQQQQQQQAQQQAQQAQQAMMTTTQFQPSLFQSSQVTGDFITFGTTNTATTPQANPFATSYATSSPVVSNPFATNVIQPTPPVANPFATNYVASSPVVSNPFATNVVSSQPGFQQTSQNQATPIEHQQRAAQSLREKEELEAKIRELEATYTRLLEVFRKEQEENHRLRAELEKKDSGLAQSHQELEAKLALQQEQFLSANKAIRSHLDATRQNYEQEKTKLVADQVAYSKNSLHQYLFRFDDFNFAGNMAANGEDVLQGSAKVQESYDKLLRIVEEGGDVVGASAELAQRMQKLLEDSKGLANKVDDHDLKIKLMEDSRNMTRYCGRLLVNAQELVGRRPTMQERDEMRERRNGMQQTVTSIQNAIQTSGKKGMDSLDSLAEMELSNASRVIAEAAESLRIQAEQQRRKELELIQQQEALGFDITEMKKKASHVGEIALNVTNAAQMLIASAVAAQQERVARGIEAKSAGESYHVDPMWAEGLISAAKAVASSMRVLCSSANNALNGNVDEASLVSCCRAVAAHTGKLQISSKVKADRDSPAQISMDKAAKLVKDTTNDLVAETKRVADFEEVSVDLKVKETEVGLMRAEMELEGTVSRLRADVDKANKQLYDVRKNMYGAAREGAEAKGFVSPRTTPMASDPQQKKQNFDKSRSVVDTSSIASPFGKGPSLTDVRVNSSSTTTTQEPFVPTPAPFANHNTINITGEEETLVLPKYMQSKLAAVPDDSSAKFEKALKEKQELELKARPIHLQHELNQKFAGLNVNANSNKASDDLRQQQQQQQQQQPQQQQQLPPQQQPQSQTPFFQQQESNPFLTNPAPNANPFLTTPPQQQQQQDSNPFLSSPPQQDSNPFLPPPSQIPNNANPFGTNQPSNPFF